MDYVWECLQIEEDLALEEEVEEEAIDEARAFWKRELQRVRERIAIRDEQARRFERRFQKILKKRILTKKTRICRVPRRLFRRWPPWGWPPWRGNPDLRPRGVD